MTQTPVRIELDHVSLAGTDRPRLADVCLTIGSGRTAIVGLSGAGKTSLLHVMAGFEQPDSGTVRIGGSECSPMPCYWVPQNLGLWSHLSAWQHLECVSYRGVDGDPGLSPDSLLERLGLTPKARTRPTELSQGEKSRLAVARALATRAAVLFLDEPLAHVDPIRKPGCWDAILEISQATSSSLVFSSHEPETVFRYADSVVGLQDGRLVFHGPVTELYDNPPNQVLGQFLGPLNWLDPEEVRILFPGCPVKASGLAARPEHVIVSRDPNGHLEIQQSRSLGSHSESRIRHHGTSWSGSLLHTHADGLAPGSRVRLRLLKRTAD